MIKCSDNFAKKCNTFNNSVKPPHDASDQQGNSNLLKQCNDGDHKRSNSKTKLRSCNCQHTIKRENNNVRKNIQQHTKSNMNRLVKHVKKLDNLSTGINKTWFEVLKESPREFRIEKIEHDKKNIASTFVKKKSQELNNFKNTESKNFRLLMSKLYQRIYETKNEELVRLITEINSVREEKENHNESKKNTDSGMSGYFGVSKVCNTDLKPIQKNIIKSFASNHKETRYNELFENYYPTDAILKTLIKLFESMQLIGEKTESHHESLQSLIHLISQLREENKMLNELKEIRINLESKFAGLSVENKCLQKQLHDSENERNNINCLLKMKDKEIEILKNHITKIKGTIANKIDNDIDSNKNEHFEEEFQNIDESFASVPSNNHSFDVMIRPASSSPTENILKNKEKSVHITEDRYQLNEQEKKEHSDENVDFITRNTLINNVKKTVDNFQLQTDVNEVCLNLSDTTYNFSLSSANFNV